MRKMFQFNDVTMHGQLDYQLLQNITFIVANVFTDLFGENIEDIGTCAERSWF